MKTEKAPDAKTSEAIRDIQRAVERIKTETPVKKD